MASFSPANIVPTTITEVSLLRALLSHDQDLLTLRSDIDTVTAQLTDIGTSVNEFNALLGSVRYHALVGG